MSAIGEEGLNLFLQERLAGIRLEIALVLGSGLGALADQVDVAQRIPYSEIPAFPSKQVPGHQGELLIGSLAGHSVLLFCGRFHVYQGITAYAATAPIRLAALAGCHSILLTSAVGGIASGLRAGDFLLVRDHLNFSGLSPLQGLDPPAFVDLHDCYRNEFQADLEECANRLGSQLHSGVLAYMPGPQYETPAEIVALGTLGASAVGMSAVLEAVMARSCGLQVASLALVTNIAGGSDEEPLSHQDVLAVSQRAEASFRHLVLTILKVLSSG